MVMHYHPPQVKRPPKAAKKLPTHLELPESDGTFVNNFHEHPQSMLLTETIQPVLDERHPHGDYCIGQDSGIYWELTEPVLDGCVAPDWFYVAGVFELPPGHYRRSYVLWQEHVRPTLVVEFVSGDGSEERDKTPRKGKFWIYERAIQAPYYAIYEATPPGLVEVYHRVQGRYQFVSPNVRGHYPILPMGIELGIWHGIYRNKHMPWLRGWDSNGVLLPTGQELNQQIQQEKAQAQAQAEQERREKERLIERLRELGIDPDTL